MVVATTPVVNEKSVATPARTDADTWRATQRKYDRLLIGRAFLLLAVLVLSIVVAVYSGKAIKLLHDDRRALAQRIPGAQIYATDAIAACGTMVAAGGIATICHALSLLIDARRLKNRRSGTLGLVLPLLSFAAIFLLAASIAGAVIVFQRSAKPSAPGIPSSTIDRLIAATGKSFAYADTPANVAAICSWVSFALTLVTIVLALLGSIMLNSFITSD